MVLAHDTLPWLEPLVLPISEDSTTSRGPLDPETQRAEDLEAPPGAVASRCVAGSLSWQRQNACRVRGAGSHRVPLAFGSQFLTRSEAVRLPVGARISPHLSCSPPRVKLGHPWAKGREDSQVEKGEVHLGCGAVSPAGAGRELTRALGPSEHRAEGARETVEEARPALLTFRGCGV